MPSYVPRLPSLEPAPPPSGLLDGSMPTAPWNAPNGWVVWFANWTKTISKFAWGTLRHLNACSNMPNERRNRESEGKRGRRRKGERNEWAAERERWSVWPLASGKELKVFFSFYFFFFFLVSSWKLSYAFTHRQVETIVIDKPNFAKTLPSCTHSRLSTIN